MARFTYRTWGGTAREIIADTVEFAHTHVVFRKLEQDGHYRIVLAEDANNVRELVEIVEPGGASNS